MRVYIAGNGHEHNRFSFEDAARRLASTGAEVSSPYHPELGLDPASWTGRRIEHILRCDAVITLPGGGMAGVDELLARAAGVPVRPLREIVSGAGHLQVA